MTAPLEKVALAALNLDFSSQFSTSFLVAVNSMRLEVENTPPKVEQESQKVEKQPAEVEKHPAKVENKPGKVELELPDVTVCQGAVIALRSEVAICSLFST